jgi:hypothetical protein
MFKVTITGIGSDINQLERDLAKTVKNLADEVYLDARANTPVRSGNARKNWNKNVTDKDFVVNNRVPYIERLEAGASRQAPKGIIGPTLSQVKGKV